MATKGTALDAAAGALAGRFPDAMVVTVQNGLGAEQIVRRHGDWPLVSGVTFMSGTRHDDTHVEYILDTETWLGPYNGIPYERVEELAELIERSGLKARAFPDLKPAQWSKLIFNATVNAVAALTGLPHDPHFAAEEQSLRPRPSRPRADGRGQGRRCGGGDRAARGSVGDERARDAARAARTTRPCSRTWRRTARPRSS